MSRRPPAGISAVALVLLVAVIIAIVILVAQSGVGPDGLVSHVDEYIAMLDNRTNDPPSARPTGRVVVVDSEMKRLDDLHSRIPSSLRAENHSDVGTVVVLVRSGTGIGAGTASGLGVTTLQQGSYSISAFLFSKDGTAIGAHSVTTTTSMSGAGAEAEARADADRDILAWIEAQF